MKLKLKTKKRIQGSISIFLVIILVPTMLLSGLLVDLSRFSMAKAMISSAGDLTMNAALADYDAILKEVYGLFAISQDDADLYKNLNEYFKTTLVSNGVVSEKDSKNYVDTLLGNLRQYLYVDKNSGEVNMNDVSNLFDMQISAEAAVKGAEGSTLANPTILKKQIVEYMKYRAPINIGLSFFSSLNSISKSGQQAEVVQSKITAEEKTTDVQSAAKTLYDDLVKYDNRLYEASEIAVGKGLTSASKNDTENFVGYVNTEIYRDQMRNGSNRCKADDSTLWDYQTVNQYVLGFLLDDTVEKVNFDEDKPEDAESGLKDKKWEKGEDVNKDDIKKALDEAADELDEKVTALDEDNKLFAAYECDGEEDYIRDPDSVTFARFFTENFLRTEYDISQSGYKTLRGVLATNLVSTQNYSTKYTEYLRAAAEMEATYLDAVKYLKKVIDDKKDAEGEKANELAEKANDIQEIFEHFLNDRKKGDSNPSVYDGLNAPDANGELPDEGKCELKSFEVEEIKKADRIKTIYEYIYRAYTDYIQYAESYVNDLTHDIAKEADYIYTKATELKKQLEQIDKDFDALLAEVDRYNTALNSWEASNQNYEKSENNNQADEFSANNNSEIEANRKRYNKESIQKLREYCKAQYEKIDPFVSYLDSNSSWKYGSTKIKDIKTADEAVSAISGTTAATDYINGNGGYKNHPASLPSATCDRQLQILCGEKYSGNSFGLFSIFKPRETITGEPAEIQEYAGYLKCTFQQEQQVSKTVSDGEAGGTDTDTEDSKELYDSLKNQMSEGQQTDQQESTDGSADKYGYTYYGKTIPNARNESSNTSSNTSVNADEASNEYTKQKNSAAGFLSGIGQALENGRDNIFVMEYIMSNFSYNTKVQDVAYKNKTNDKDDFTFYTEAESDASGEMYKNYKALTASEKAAYAKDGKTDENASTRPTTLSGYPISSYNNEFYGAEVEYLFFGMNGAQNNVTAAYSSIYAIRFVLNSIYAFSNTEIRNMARTAGLSVQAATAGIIPYQAVMVTVQLALSMSESVLDLQIMKTGAKVAVVPSKDTWILSPTGAKTVLKTVVKAKTKELANQAVSSAINNVSTGLQNFIDSSADKMTEYAQDLNESLTNTAQAKADELLDDAFAQVEGTLFTTLNELQYVDYTTTDPQTELDNAFIKARETKNTVIANLKSNQSDVARAISDIVSSQLDTLLNDAQTQANAKLNDIAQGSPQKGAADYITSYLYEIETDISNSIKQNINAVSQSISQSVTSVVSGVQSELRSAVQAGTEEAKQEAVKSVNNFIDKSINSVTDKIPDMSGLASENQSFSGSSAVSHAISFGYSDYLRLFIFVGLYNENNDILIRTANLIEQNINYPNKAEETKDVQADSFFGELYKKISWFFGGKKSDGESTENSNKWQMTKAYTYVQIDADIDMDMFFMKTSLFNNWMNAGMAEIGADELDTTNTKSTYHYHSVMGY